MTAGATTLTVARQQELEWGALQIWDRHLFKLWFRYSAQLGDLLQELHAPLGLAEQHHARIHACIALQTQNIFIALLCFSRLLLHPHAALLT